MDVPLNNKHQIYSYEQVDEKVNIVKTFIWDYFHMESFVIPLKAFMPALDPKMDYSTMLYAEA